MRRPGGRAVALIERQGWTLRRFGLTPAGLVRRAANRGQPRIVCVSVPKAGTHLLERALCLHPALYRPLVPTLDETNLQRHGGLPRLLERLRPGGILVAHLTCRPDWAAAVDDAGVRPLLMLRDPRDVVVSQAHYVASSASHPWHARYRALPAVRDRIALTIAGDDAVVPIAQLLHGYADWEGRGALVVRFEDLVGAAGGGDDARQRRCLVDVYRHLGMPLPDERLEEIRAGLFSSRSPTFRRGAIGQWRDAFDEGTSALFEREAAGLLDAMGYAAV